MRLAGYKPARREGTREGRWVLLDYVDIVVHIQHQDERTFYALDRLWRDCPIVDVDLDVPQEDSLGFGGWSCCATVRQSSTPAAGCRANSTPT